MSFGERAPASKYYYGYAGATSQLEYVDVQKSGRRVEYANDLSNQVINRRETMPQGYAAGPQEYWYRFGGKELAYVGNNNTITTDYVASISNRTASQGTGMYMNGATSPTSVNDTDQGYDSINSFDSGSLESTDGYSVQAGDTLQGIAAQLWGDSALWYKLAEANGLVGDEALIEGTTLTVPPGIIRNTYNSSTFTPYDPNDIVGNVAPKQKMPGHGPGCGLVGQIIIALIAVAVFFAVAGPFGDVIASPIIAAAAAGATSSVVSQVAAVATGVQDKFSWGQVGLAAFSAGLGQGLSGIGPIASAVATNVATQGVAMLTHMQDNFSWASVAASAISAGVVKGVQHILPTGMNAFAASFIAHTAGGIANAATRSLIDGTDFGDAMLQALPDVFAQIASDGMSGSFRRAASQDTEQTSYTGPSGEFDDYGDVSPRGARAGMLSHVRYDTSASYGSIGGTGGPGIAGRVDPMSWLTNVVTNIGDFVGDFFGFDDGGFDIRNFGLHSSVPNSTDSDEIIVRARNPVTAPGFVITTVGAQQIAGMGSPTIVAGGVNTAPGFAPPGAGNIILPLVVGGAAATRELGLFRHYTTGQNVTPLLSIPYEGSPFGFSTGPGGASLGGNRPLPVQEGFVVITRDQEEAALVASLQAQRKSAREINSELSIRRLNNGDGTLFRFADGAIDIDTASRRYGELVASNLAWSWDNDFREAFTIPERGLIRQEAIGRGLVPTVSYKAGTDYLDFEGAGLVYRSDVLPSNLWTSSNAAQAAWLNGRIAGGQPVGTTWHHTEIPGRMELVPFGVHNVYQHSGGRSPGQWAYRKG